MDEKLKDALLLYGQGNTLQAAKLLEKIVSQDSGNSIAWYMLALSHSEPALKITCLKKVLALDPSHQEAQQLLENLQDKKKIQPSDNIGIVKNFIKETLDDLTSIEKKLLTALISIVLFLLLVGGVVLFKDSTKKSKIVPIFPTPSIVPTNTHIPLPTPTSQPALLPGPARRYAPITNEGMPADYIYPIVNEYRLDDGDYYNIKHYANDSLILGEPTYFFSAFAANTIDIAIKKYKETSETFQVDSDNRTYDWSNNTYTSTLFDEAGQYTSSLSSTGGLKTVGRVFRINNIIVLIEVGLGNYDTVRGFQDLDKFTGIVEQKFR